MAVKDNQPKEFTTPEGKRYRKTVDKKGKAHYTVFDVNKKTNKFIDAKEFVKEGSRFRAQERIRKLKEEADNKKRLEEEKKAAQILEAERKVREAEFARVQRERAIKNAERKRIKKEAETLEQAKELSRFLNTVSDENDIVAQMTNKLLDHYDESVRVTYWRGLSKQFLRLSEVFTDLDRKFSDIYLKVSKKKIVTEQDIKEFDALVTKSDPLFKKFEGLIIEAETRKKAFLDKEAIKDKKRKDKKRTERIDAVRKGREEKSKRVEREKAEELERIKEGEKAQLFDSYDQEKQRRLAKREKSDKFFSTDSEDLSNTSKKLIGGSKVIGGLAMSPLNFLGIDFNDELNTLGSVFSPFGKLGKSSLGLLKSGTQKLQGIDDKSIESLEDVFTNPGLGKKKKIDVDKVNKNLSNKPKSIIGGFKEKLASMFGTSNSNVSNNTQNMFNSSTMGNQSTNSFAQTSVSNRPQVMGGIQSQVIDYNRTDDKDEFKQGERTNELLEKILKQLGGNPQTVKTKRGMFGGGLGGLGTLAKVGIPAFAAWKVGSQAGETINSFLETNSILNSSIKNTSSVLENKLKEKGASKKDIRTIKMLSIREVEARTNNNVDELKTIKNERNEILKKYSISPSNISNVSNSQSSDSTSFRNSEKNSTIKAEINRIEKINDVKYNPEKAAEDMKRFLEGPFIEKISTAIATKMVQSKGNGSNSVMPPLPPF